MGKIYDKPGFSKKCIGFVDSDGKGYDKPGFSKKCIGFVESPHVQRSGAALICIIK